MKKKRASQRAPLDTALARICAVDEETAAEITKIVGVITSDMTSEQAVEAALAAVTPSLLDSMLVTALAALTNKLCDLPAKQKARILRLIWEMTDE